MDSGHKYCPLVSMSRTLDASTDFYWQVQGLWILLNDLCWQLLGPRIIVLISTAMIGTLDCILTSSGKERDSG